jgi:hypothetical protein
MSRLTKNLVNVRVVMTLPGCTMPPPVALTGNHLMNAALSYCIVVGFRAERAVGIRRPGARLQPDLERQPVWPPNTARYLAYGHMIDDGFNFQTDVVGAFRTGAIDRKLLFTPEAKTSRMLLSKSTITLRARLRRVMS